MIKAKPTVESSISFLTLSSDTAEAVIIGHSVQGASSYTTLGYGGNDIRAAHGNITWATVSDERVKKDIEDSTVGLAFINDLRPVTFNYKNKGDLPENFSCLLYTSDAADE